MICLSVAHATDFQQGRNMCIFKNIEQNNLKPLLDCLRAVKKTYKKNEIIIDIKDEITAVAYISKGKVQITKDDYEGNNVIIETLGDESTFAEAFVCAGITQSPVCAKALEDTEILFLDFKRILTTCPNACQFHRTLIENLIKTVASKNLLLQERIELLSKKTLRERIFYLLYKERAKNNSDIFEIPYSREQMAIFLCADRSALSRELSKMKNEELIDFQKNTFKFINHN